MTPQDLLKTLQAALSPGHTDRPRALAILQELTPLKYEPLRLACARLSAQRDPRRSPFTQATLTRCAAPPAPRPHAPPPPQRSPLTQNERDELAQQLNALLLDLKLSLPLQPLDALARMRREVILGGARQVIARAHPDDLWVSACLCSASRALAERLLLSPERWFDEAYQIITAELSALEPPSLDDLIDLDLEFDDLIALSHPAAQGVLEGVLERLASKVAPRPPAAPLHPTAPEGEWRALLSPRVSPERLDDVCFLATRRGRTQRRTLQGKELQGKAPQGRAPQGSSPQGVSFEMVLCPAGDFIMGSYQCYKVQPPHPVSVTRPFWLGRTPVTIELWEAVMGEVKGPTPPWHRDSPNLPITRVTWFEAVRFCNALSALEGLPLVYALGEGRAPTVKVDLDAGGYRLPTEAEWERAAKAGTELKYAGSDVPSQVAHYLHRHRDHGDPSRATPQPCEVASHLPNAYGLYDMSGCVWEWCSDEWIQNYSARAQGERVTDPCTHPEVIFRRAARGGGFDSGALSCAVAYRDERSGRFRYPSQGLRLCRNAL